jgi:hypothetical protein
LGVRASHECFIGFAHDSCKFIAGLTHRLVCAGTRGGELAKFERRSE